MKKLFVTSIMGFLLLAAVAAANPMDPADYNGLNKGNSNVHHLYMYEKDSEWNIVEYGAWAKMTFNANKDTFVVNANGLMADTEYALIHYMGDSTGDWRDAHIIETGYTDMYGNLHLSGEWSIWSGKFWIVTKNDITGDADGPHPAPFDQFSAWNPSEYLFEYNVFDFE